MSEPILCAAGPEHADDMVATIRSGFDPSFVSLTVYGAHGIAAYIRHLIAAPAALADTVYTVALVEGQTAGCVEMRRLPQALFLNYISFLPQYRSLGLGRHLLRAAMEQAGLAGRGEMLLDVLEHNEIARGWYERLGFERQEVSEWWEIPLPEGGEAPPALIAGLPQAQACHAAFGFSQLKIMTAGGDYLIGRMGEKWFRVTQPEPLLDRDLLVTLAGLDPARSIHAILREGQLPEGFAGTATPRGRFWRMRAPLDVVLKRLPEPRA